MTDDTTPAAESEAGTRRPAARGPVRHFTVAPDDDGIRLDRWFQRHLPGTPFATVSRWARTGQIRLDGARVAPEDRLQAGRTLRLPPHVPAAPRRRAELTEEERATAQGMVILRTPSALVLNKPPGLATQGGTGTHQHLDRLLDAFAQGDEPRPRLVHRLDKDTSGALLVARTPGSAAFFSRRFAGRSAKKVYWALVVGVPDEDAGTIDAPLAKQPGTGGEKMHIDREGGQAARTRFRVVDRAGNRAAWVELEPLTGRTHQLRVHMAAIGHPIVGDGKYGGAAAFLTGSVSRKMHLHARRLRLDAPEGGSIDAVADLPEHFAASMAQLGFDPADSDAGGAPAQPPPSREQKKQAAKAHAKQLRKSKPARRARAAAPKPPARSGKSGPSRGGPGKGRPSKSGPGARGR